MLLRLHSAAVLWLDEAQSVAIAREPLAKLPAALREDGSPPLYYYLLHFWMAAFGTGTDAVRSLSALLSVAAVVVAYYAGRAVAGTRCGWYAAVLTASSPFAIRYASETRMYALLTLLALLEVLVVVRAWRRPALGNLAALAVVSGLLALTHYWALFFLLALGGVLAVGSIRGPAVATARRMLVGLLAGGILFLPWLPSFVYQSRHTGTPWAPLPGLGTMFAAMRGWGGLGRSNGASEPLYVLLIVLTCAALFVTVDGFGERVDTRALVRRPRDVRALTLLALGFGSLVLGTIISHLEHAGFAPRYSGAALSAMLVLQALGATRLPRRAGALLVAAAVVLGLATSIDAPFSTMRTQAGRTAALLRARAQPGDLVVYCPDQLGPSLHRLLPSTIDQIVYPTLGSAERVNWVDYAERNAKADPQIIAAQIDERAHGAVWLVRADGYRTLSTQCAALDVALQDLRCGRYVAQTAVAAYYEREALIRFQPCAVSGTG